MFSEIYLGEQTLNKLIELYKQLNLKHLKNFELHLEGY